MREIKFRAWNERRKKMFYFDLFSTDEGYLVKEEVSIDEDCVMQFTGLHDKNGTPIYEGDIVRINSCNGTIVGAVKFDEGCFVLDYLNRFINQRMTNELYSWLPKAIEVIGNIYENPELLQEDSNG